MRSYRPTPPREPVISYIEVDTHDLEEEGEPDTERSPAARAREAKPDEVGAYKRTSRAHSSAPPDPLSISARFYAEEPRILALDHDLSETGDEIDEEEFEWMIQQNRRRTLRLLIRAFACLVLLAMAALLGFEAKQLIDGLVTPEARAKLVG
jgi:hypothetical protein